VSNDGIVIVLDFTREAEPESREKLMHSFRSTTSSRRPGRAIEGTVVTMQRSIVTCPHCGGKRMDYDGPHGLMNTNEVGINIVNIEEIETSFTEETDDDDDVPR
jgi:hypothetical protein